MRGGLIRRPDEGPDQGVQAVVDPSRPTRKEIEMRPRLTLTSRCN